MIEIMISIFDLNDLILAAIKIDAESYFHNGRYRRAVPHTNLYRSAGMRREEST